VENYKTFTSVGTRTHDHTHDRRSPYQLNHRGLLFISVAQVPIPFHGQQVVNLWNVILWLVHEPPAPSSSLLLVPSWLSWTKPLSWKLCPTLISSKLYEVNFGLNNWWGRGLFLIFLRTFWLVRFRIMWARLVRPKIKTRPKPSLIFI